MEPKQPWAMQLLGLQERENTLASTSLAEPESERGSFLEVMGHIVAKATWPTTR